MKKKYTIQGQKIDEVFCHELDISHELGTILVNRGFDTKEGVLEFLSPQEGRLYKPEMLNGIERACTLIKRKIAAKRRIRIFGDYDVDGIMSVYILFEGLSGLGADVSYRIPDRIKDGYGINDRLVDEAITDGVEVIITCDNGIAATEPLNKAKQAGICVIITDHHDIPEILPDADAIIDPKLKDNTYPFKEICGAAVAYKLIKHMYDMYDLYKYSNGKKHAGCQDEIYSYCTGIINENADGYDKLNLKKIHDEDYWLMFAGIATVCDVCKLLDENRTIVAKALLLLKRTDNKGLLALKNETGLNSEYISTYHVGFVLGPCINACGRLDDASLGVRLLLSETAAEAEKIAKRLHELNEERKKLTNEGTKSVSDDMAAGRYGNNKVMLVYLKGVHESIVGIIAGKLREIYNKPVFVFTDTAPCIEYDETQKISVEMLKASGRSIPEYNMFAELQKCSELLYKSGGHALAAGLTIRKDLFAKLSEQLNSNCKLTEDDLTLKVRIELFMPLENITENIINELDKLEPFGQGNEKPVIAAKNVEILRARIFGRNKNVLKLTLNLNNEKTMDGLYFGNIDEFRKNIINKYGADTEKSLFTAGVNGLRLSVIYYPQINEYNNLKSLQVVINDFIW